MRLPFFFLFRPPISPMDFSPCTYSDGGGVLPHTPLFNLQYSQSRPGKTEMSAYWHMLWITRTYYSLSSIFTSKDIIQLSRRGLWKVYQNCIMTPIRQDCAYQSNVNRIQACPNLNSSLQIKTKQLTVAVIASFCVASLSPDTEDYHRRGI